MAGTGSFQYEVETSATPDAHGNKVTTISCHGRLVSENSGDLKEVIKPLLPLGGRIVIDLSDVSYIDSSGLGALVGLKISAIKQGLVLLEFVNMTPRVLELMRITNIAQLLSPEPPHFKAGAS
jgi:anti-sigma B factor antagonist